MCQALILIPLFSVIILNLPFISKAIAFWFLMLLSLVQVGIAIFASPQALATTANFGPFGAYLNLNLAADNISRLMLLCIGIVSFATLFVVRHSTSDEDKRFNYVNLIFLALAGMNGIVMVQDIFTLYVFIEIVAIASFILISFNKDINAFESAFKYIILSVVATVMILTAIALFLLSAPDTNFSSIYIALQTSPHNFVVMFAVGLLVCGLFIKSGLMPFHAWLPSAYSMSPNPVSVFLAGIVTKIVGLYVLIRISSSVLILDGRLRAIILIVGAFSVIAGALAALGQSNFKKMLSYSSISQMGYVILGLGTGLPLGLAAALFHMFNHSIFKSLLFVNAAALESQAGTHDMDKMSGFAQKMPVTGVTSVIGGLSLAGIPPLAGFWSKLFIIVALWVAGYYLYAILAILGSVITLAYFLTLQRKVFFGKLGLGFEGLKDAGADLIIPSLVLAAIIVLVGVFFPLLTKSILFPTGL